MVPISVTLACALWVGAVAVELSRAAAPAVFPVILNASVVMLDLLSLGAVAVVALRARTVPAEEKRRVVLFSVAFVVWAGWVTTGDLVQVFMPGYWLTNFRWTSSEVA